eukprot:6584226-Karenia_brevis.AAC.1
MYLYGLRKCIGMDLENVLGGPRQCIRMDLETVFRWLRRCVWMTPKMFRGNMKENVQRKE